MKSTTFLVKAFNLFKNDEENIHSSVNAIKTIVSEHERAHAGKMFGYTDVSTLAAGDDLALLIAVPADGEEVHLRSLGIDINVGPCIGGLYEDPYIDPSSLGTGFRPRNTRRSARAYTSTTSFYQGTGFNVNSLGEEIEAAAVVQDTGGTLKTIKGEAEGVFVEWILQPGHTYLGKFNNGNGTTGIYELGLHFYEP